MLSVNDISLQFGKRVLFDEVNISFGDGNCYGIIGANGAGKSTFLKILSGEIEANQGHVSLEPGKRMAVLSQNHFAYNEFTALDTVIMGHKKMYDIMVEKNAIYMDPDATEADGMKAAELEQEYGEMGGWNAETDSATLLSHLGLKESEHYKLMKDLTGNQRVKVLLAQVLFGNPDIVLLDEPTNDLDAETVTWLADFLADFKNTVIVVSHDRYFLDMVCTHIVDIDYKKVKQYSGNYTFWYESSQLMSKQMADKNKKTDQKRKELMEFIQRFSANASKSKQATSRKKALEKLKIENIQPSSRKYPYIAFKPEREPGDQILKVTGLTKRDSEGKVLFQNVDLMYNKKDKIALYSKDPNVVTSFFEVISGEQQADGGSIEWGQTITSAYLPNDNGEYFSGDQDVNLVDWLREYSEEKDEQFIRGFLGRMLFSGEEVMKKSSVLSGGEKVRCMLSKLMLANPNFLVLDEPTNHLDLESITALNNGLSDFGYNLMMYSHDHELMNTVCNRIVEITPNGVIDKLMSWNDYLKSEDVKAQREALYAK